VCLGQSIQATKASSQHRNVQKTSSALPSKHAAFLTRRSALLPRLNAYFDDWFASASRTEALGAQPGPCRWSRAVKLYALTQVHAAICLARSFWRATGLVTESPRLSSGPSVYQGRGEQHSLRRRDLLRQSKQRPKCFTVRAPRGVSIRLSGSGMTVSFLRVLTNPLACFGNPDPVGMKVYAPSGEETFDDIQTTEEAQAGADCREAA
jgi:hypothetical protein